MTSRRNVCQSIMNMPLAALALAGQLKANGWYRDFPPQGIEVVSWYVLMGIGQVVTLRFPAERLREINRLLEEEAWGAYRTEFYATYDYRALYQAEREKNLK